MTTFTGDVNVRTLDSSVTAINLQRGGGAVFTGPVTFASSVYVSGASGLVVAAVSAGGIVATTAGNPQLAGVAPSTGRLGCRGLLQFTVDGTAAYIPFFYATAPL